MSKTVPYKGSEPYIFISYAHRDKAQVYPVLAQMQADGYRIWFDEGIDPGTEWDEVIAEHVEQCGYFLAFLSENYLASENCKDELNYARDLEKKRLLVYLEDVKLRGGLAMRLNRLQSIFKHKYANEADFFAMLYAADGISELRGAPSAAVPEPTPAPKAASVKTPSRGLAYESVGGQYRVAGIGTCTDTELYIPSTHEGKPVTSFKMSAFENNKTITAVTLAEGGLAMNRSVFQKCTALTEIELPDGPTELPSMIFDGCTALCRVRLPQTLTTIGIWAFGGCKSLSTIAIPHGVTDIGSSAFRGCTALTEIELPDGLTEISGMMFDGCTALCKVKLPKTITTISHWAFDGCKKLPSITIPRGVTKIDKLAFQNCLCLREIRFEGSMAEWAAIEKGEDWRRGTPTITVICTDGTVTEKDTSTAVPAPKAASVKTPSRGLAYEYFGSKYEVAGIGTCTDTELYIPATYEGKPVTSFKTSAFEQNATITAVTLAEGFLSVDVSVFKNCTALKSVCLPSTITRLWGSAFRGCTALTEIELPDGPTELPSMIFDGCTALCKVKLPKTITTISAWAFDGCKKLPSITIPHGVTKIDKLAFQNCLCLREIRFEGSMAEWAAIEKAENWCQGVPDVTILCTDGTVTKSDPAPVTTARTDVTASTSRPAQDSQGFTFSTSSGGLVLAGIGSCRDSAVVIPATHDGKPLYEVGTEAFKDVSTITSLVISEGVKVISIGAFRGCAALSSVTLPDTLTKIWSSAFRGCTALTSISFPDSLGAIENMTCDGCRSLSSVKLPKGATRIGEWAFDSCVSLTSIDIPASVLVIDKKAFVNCTSLTEIRFGGTCGKWRAITKGAEWKKGAPAITVRCTDGALTEY